jgi:UDP:flavonoid glycosyltransferase YjiC (YdhE family)
LRYYARHFNRSRKRRGLKPADDIFAIMESPFANLIADLPELIPCAGAPPHVRYIGPLIWEPSAPEPEWLARLDPSRPCVYVTMGSTGEAGAFKSMLTALVEAGYQVLCTTGGQLGEIPKGVFATSYAPGSALARRCVATVCHGGSLTIYQSLGVGVPVIAIPTFHDQEINAERLEATGLGARLPPRRWDKGQLAALVQRAKDGDFRPATSAAVARIAMAQQSQRAWAEKSRGKDVSASFPPQNCQFPLELP